MIQSVRKRKFQISEPSKKDSRKGTHLIDKY